MHTAAPAIALLLALGLIIGEGPVASDPPNMAANPGFEQGISAKGLPADWGWWVGKGGEAQCVVDESVAHTGKASARVTAKSDVQAVLLSKAIPVALGEKFDVSAWFRGEGFATNTDGGRVAFTVSFLDASGFFARLERFGKPLAGTEWQQLSGTVEVPEDITDMLLEVGLGMAHGTVWADDATIIPRSVLAVRPAAGHMDLPPGSGTLPVQIINRGGLKQPIELSVECSGRTNVVDAALDGSPLQIVEVPIAPANAGNQSLGLKLLDPSSRAMLASSKYRVRVLAPVDLEPPIPTHFCIEDGKPVAEVRVWSNLPPAQVGKLVVTLSDASGKVLAESAVTDLASGPKDVRLAPGSAPIGDYQISASLHTRSGETHTVTQPWHIIHRAQARVTIDDQGFPVADGKRVYVLGTFNSGRYEMMKQIGFTVTHAWNRVNLPPKGQRITHQSVKDFLDDTQKAGMKAVLLIRHFAALKEWDECRRRIRMFRNHPALLAWVEEEEVARGQIKIGDLERYVKLIREEDPNHPFVLADSYAEITEVDRSKFFRNDLMDIGMWWYYPIPLAPAGANLALEGQDSTDGSALPVPSFMSSTTKPVWVGLQAYKKPRPDGRIPTPAEYRCMAYLMLVHGATGLLYYMGGSAWKVAGEDNPDRPWGYLHDLVPELAQMMPVFAEPDAGGVSVQPPGSAPIDTAFKRSGDEYTLIAVNRGSRPVEATLACEHVSSGEIEVLFENRRVRASAGKIRDAFEPYAVHIYRWK